MTLQDYLRVFRRRWPILLVCTLVAAAVMWRVTPANAGATRRSTRTPRPPPCSSVAKGTDQLTSVSMGRIALYLTTGEIPRNAAKALGYDGDPAVLASGLTVDAGHDGPGLEGVGHRAGRRARCSRGQRLRGGRP